LKRPRLLFKMHSLDLPEEASGFLPRVMPSPVCGCFTPGLA
jgi:hypothetical protein